MKIGIAGIWHLGLVYSVCLSDLGHNVIGFDPDQVRIENLKKNITPIFEPGLNKILSKNLESRKLQFSANSDDLCDVDLFILAFDTPVDDNDNPNNNYVLEKFKNLVVKLNDNAVVMIISQLPVGTAKFMSQYLQSIGKFNPLIVQPENLRLGKAVDAFMDPGRIIIGTNDGKSNSLIESAFEGIRAELIWMHTSSAEMTKHSINAFLATSITFMAEIAEICEVTGADAQEVERGLKSESRIGPKAYLSPGLGFAGGTLARDVKTLVGLQSKIRNEASVIGSLLISNRHNNSWLQRQLEILTKDFIQPRVCFWGITYTENTSTLRRSEIYTLMCELEEKNFQISFVENQQIDDQIRTNFAHKKSLEDSLDNIDILVVSKKMHNLELNSNILSKLIEGKFAILDPSRNLLSLDAELIHQNKYFTVGAVR